jgi:dipeptidyl aminopeptidase/acylaminoacyl peptidase
MMAAVLTCSATISLAVETAKRAITPEDVVNIRIVDDPKISPDGKSVAFTVTEPADTSKPDEARNSDIWIVSTNGNSSPRKYAFGPKQEIMPRWSPDGNYLAFLSNRGKDEKNQIYFMSTSGGEAETLTSMKEGVDFFKWGRDSHSISFVARDSLSSDEEKRNKAKDDERVLDENVKQARLYRMDLTSRAVTLLTPENESINDFDYSPDGVKIAFEVAPTPGMDDVYYRSKLMVMNRDGSATHVISEESSGLGNIRWSPDSKQILHFIYPGKSEMYIPELVSPSGAQTTTLGEDYPGAIWEMEWIPNRQEILVSSQEGVQGTISMLEVKSKQIDRVRTVGRPYYFWIYPNWSINATGEWIAFVDASASSPNDIWIMKVDGSDARRLTDFNPQVSSLAFGSVEKVQWKAEDGQQIEGVLVKPAGYEPGKKYPLVVQIQGGPAWAWWYGWLSNWHNWTQLLASNKFVVLLPNPRGGTSRGLKFAELNLSDWGGGDFKDIMAGVDYLIQQGIADSTQMAIGGWSYGGYMTAWAVSQTNRFKAAVMGAGLSNLASFYGTTDTPTCMRWYFEDYPYGREQVYDQHSPMTFIKNVRTPTLILHGEADLRVPITQSYEFYQGLKDMGVETRFVTYPREPHWIGENAHQLDVLQRVLDWYKSHLNQPN